jgi:hypothetical protein
VSSIDACNMTPSCRGLGVLSGIHDTWFSVFSFPCSMQRISISGLVVKAPDLKPENIFRICKRKLSPEGITGQVCFN